MDDTFFQELDAHITNAGTDKVWKKQVGHILVWFSPIPYTAQLKANQTILDEELGTSAVQETKRVALSHSIVGFDAFDLREFRNSGPVFPMTVMEGRTPKSVKVELHKYVYLKMAGWDSEMVDAAFEVFADLMESNKKEIVRDIKFENLKDPAEELMELEARAAELREGLNLPRMIEDSEDDPSPKKSRKSEEEHGEDYDEDDEPLDEDEDEGGDDIHPVKPIPRKGFVSTSEERRKSEPNMEMESDFNPFEKVENDPHPEPVRTVPVPQPQPRRLSPIEEELARRGSNHVGHTVQRQPPPVAGSVLFANEEPTSTPDKPYEATPSVKMDVVEQRGERTVVDPPKIDRGHAGQSRNPRFSPPGSR